MRRPAFWSQALTSQSAASAAGWVPPMTKPKNRPRRHRGQAGVAGGREHVDDVGGVGRPVRQDRARARPAISSLVSRGGTGRSASESSHSRARAWARSRPALRSIISSVSACTGSRTSLRSVKVLPAAEWRPRADAHAARVDAFVEPHLARRSEQVSHPVHDFLFTYYSHRPAQLRRWHPGFGVALEEAPESRRLSRATSRSSALAALVTTGLRTRPSRRRTSSRSARCSPSSTRC